MGGVEGVVVSQLLGTNGWDEAPGCPLQVLLNDHDIHLLLLQPASTHGTDAAVEGRVEGICHQGIQVSTSQAEGQQAGHSLKGHRWAKGNSETQKNI